MGIVFLELYDMSKLCARLHDSTESSLHDVTWLTHFFPVSFQKRWQNQRVRSLIEILSSTTFHRHA